MPGYKKSLINIRSWVGKEAPYELVRFSGNTYTSKSHDSLKISNGKWMWWSRGIGGRSALDYLIKVRDHTAAYGCYTGKME